MRRGSEPTVIVVTAQKSPGLAAVMSCIWPGLGQIYNGEILKGILMMLTSPLAGWLGLLLTVFGGLAAAGAPADSRAPGVFMIGLLLLIATPALWVYGVVNAYRSAERSNVRQLAMARPLL